VSSKVEALSIGFWQLADPKIWIASTVPMVLGVTLSVAFGKGFNLFWMLVSFIGVYLIEIGKNAINECVDYISGADPAVDSEHSTPFSGGKKTITGGLLTVRQSAVIALVTMLLAAVIGLLVVFFREKSVIYVGLMGFGLAAIYSLPPFKLCYRGLGELAVGFTFGPLVLNGMYLVMAPQFDVLPVLVSLPVGFLIANVLWINQFPDYEADISAGKKNWVVRLGKKKSVKVYAALFILAYAAVIAIAAYAMNPVWLIAFLTVPKAIEAIKNCNENYDNIPMLIRSNAATVQIYMINGVLLGIAAIIDGLML